MMNLTQFKDTSGNIWTMDLNIGHYLKFKSELSIDISESFSESNNWMAILASHEGLELLLQMLEIVLKPALNDKGMSIDDFYSNLDGDVVADATSALLESVVLFLPAHKQKAMRIILDSVAMGMDKAVAKIEKESKQMMAQAETLIDQEMDKAMKKNS